MATSGDFLPATTGDFLMATDSMIGDEWADHRRGGALSGTKTRRRLGQASPLGGCSESDWRRPSSRCAARCRNFRSRPRVAAALVATIPPCG